MSCQECMYISGHSDRCTVGLDDRVYDLLNELAKRDTLINDLSVKVGDLEDRLRKLEERHRDEDESDYWRRSQG